MTLKLTTYKCKGTETRFRLYTLQIKLGLRWNITGENLRLVKWAIVDWTQNYPSFWNQCFSVVDLGGAQYNPRELLRINSQRTLTNQRLGEEPWHVVGNGWSKALSTATWKVFMETMRTEFEGCEQNKRRFFLPHVHWPTLSTYELGKRAAFISEEHLLVGATFHSPRTCRLLK